MHSDIFKEFPSNVCSLHLFSGSAGTNKQAIGGSQLYLIIYAEEFREQRTLILGRAIPARHLEGTAPSRNRNNAGINMVA